MTSKQDPCGKVLHTSEESAGIQAKSLGEQYGLPPNIYKCRDCSSYYSTPIWHVGYGYDAEKLSKRRRRRRKRLTYRRRKRRESTE